MDDISKIQIAKCSFVPEGIQDIFREEGEEKILENINDHIPDDYGYCGDCDRGDCNDCSYRYSDDDIAEIKREAREEGYEQRKSEEEDK
jgi:hypothetical protein